MTFKTASGILLIMLFTARFAAAQDRPFVFSLATSTDTSKPQVVVDYELGVGEQTFHESNEDGPEQRIGLQASAGRWTLIGRFGVSPVGSSYRTSQEGEAWFSLLQPHTSAGTSLAVGGGMLHEASGVDVVQGRIVAGQDWTHWRLHGNVLFQHPLASGRDPVDLITSVGWARRVTPTVSLGIEALGEDLEGFWEPEEAEGGARMLVGPSLHVAPPGHKWHLSLAGGPTFHPTNSGRTSDALRDLPPITRTQGYAFRMSFGTSF